MRIRYYIEYIMELVRISINIWLREFSSLFRKSETVTFYAFDAWFKLCASAHMVFFLFLNFSLSFGFVFLVFLLISMFGLFMTHYYYSNEQCFYCV